MSWIDSILTIERQGKIIFIGTSGTLNDQYLVRVAQKNLVKNADRHIDKCRPFFMPNDMEHVAKAIRAVVKEIETE